MTLTRLATILMTLLILPAAYGQTKEADAPNLTLELQAQEGKATAGLPIAYKGSLLKSMKALREVLNRDAPREKYPDRSVQPLSSQRQKEVFINRSRLTIDAAGDQCVGWLTAILYSCSFFPGSAATAELHDSPLIRRISLRLAGTDRAIPIDLPVDTGLNAKGGEGFHYRLQLSLQQASPLSDMVDRKVILRNRATGKSLGTLGGMVPLGAEPGAMTLEVTPRSALLDMALEARYAASILGAKECNLKVDPNVPILAVHQVLETLRSSGIESFSFTCQVRLREDRTPICDSSGGASKLRLKRISALTIDKSVAARGRALGVTEIEEEEIFEEEIVDAEVVEEDEISEEPEEEVELRANASMVDRGLHWLRQHQKKDGSWSSAEGLRENPKAMHDVGVTALAALAFLGAGNTHESGPHAKVVRSALRWLAEQQEADGTVGNRKTSHGWIYDHAVATLALCESYSMHPTAEGKKAAQAAVNVCLKAQNPYKGWRYGVRPGDNDASITTWMLMALKSAQLAELEVSKNSSEWALSLLDELTDPETGRVGYTKRGERPVRVEGTLEQFPPEKTESLTAAANFARFLYGQRPDKNESMSQGITLVTKTLPLWDVPQGTVDMMYWYWGSLCCYQAGGKAWKEWSGRLSSALRAGQARDGRWPAVGPWGSAGGDVYSTSLMTMCGEVYYRYVRVAGLKK